MVLLNISSENALPANNAAKECPVADNECYEEKLSGFLPDNPLYLD